MHKQLWNVHYLILLESLNLLLKHMQGMVEVG